MSKLEIKKTTLEKFLFDTGITLTEMEEKTGLSYPTLENIKLDHPVDFRPRSLRDVASFCDCTVEELMENNVKYKLYIASKQKKKSKNISAFSQALENLEKKNNITITLDDVHKATKLSKTIFTKLKKGDTSKCSDRTLGDVAEFLGITIAELRNNKLLPKGTEEAPPEITMDGPK